MRFITEINMGSLKIKIYFNPFPIMEFSLQNSYSLNSPPYSDKIGSFNETEMILFRV